MDKCPICKEFIYSFRAHECPPKFLVQFDWQNEEGDEPRVVYADNQRTAVEQFVEQGDGWNSEFTESSAVIVMDCETGSLAAFHVYGELVRSYTATSREFDDGKIDVTVFGRDESE